MSDSETAPRTTPAVSLDHPDSMLAACIREPGPASSIEILSLTVPAPGPGQVLVRFEASEVNHVDLFVRSGAYRTLMPSPFIIGRDLVGTVVEVGQSAGDFTPGQRVWCASLGHGGRQGSFSEYVLVDAERLHALPSGTDPADAAVVLHGALTAHLGLFREGGLQAGRTAVIAGGGGAVGSAAVQMAAGAGAHVVTTASAQDADWCRELGAAEMLDHRAPHLVERLRGALAERGGGADGGGDGGADLLWDTSGRMALADALSLVSPGGRIILTAGLGETASLPVGDLYTRDVSLHGFAVSNASVGDLAVAAEDISRLLAAGSLRGRVGMTVHLADAADAHAALEQGRVHGRILVLP